MLLCDPSRQELNQKFAATKHSGTVFNTLENKEMELCIMSEETPNLSRRTALTGMD